MSITDKTHAVPAWLVDLAADVGPVVLGELIKVGADYLLKGHPVASPIDIGAARKVRDLMPDPIPNDALDDEIDAEIARREKALADAATKPFGGILADPNADTDPPPDAA